MTKTVSLLSALLCTFIWGTSFIAQDKGMDDIGPFTFNAVRFFVGFLGVAPLAYIFEKKNFSKSINKDKKTFINSVILIGLSLFLGSALQQVALLFTDVANAPAKVIKEFRKKHDKPVFKAAHLDAAFYIGEEYLDTLSDLKSKDELIAEIIMLLQSPAKNIISSLQSGGSTLSGIVKTLSERVE